MFERSYDTTATPRVIVEGCHGNLKVRGAPANRVTIRSSGDEGDVQIQQEEDVISVTCDANCQVTCPAGTTLVLRVVHGNVKAGGLTGAVEAGTIHGNASLRGCGSSSVEAVFGNVTVRQATGDLTVQVTRGNVQVRQVEGGLALGRVDGNLSARQVAGNVTAERVRGNAKLTLPFGPGTDHQLTVDGNLTVYVPPDAGLRMVLQAEGDVRSTVPGLTLDSDGTQAQGVLGTGEASLEAQAGGQISLRGFEPGEGLGEEGAYDFEVEDLEALGAEIEARIAEATADLEARLEESLGRIGSQDAHRRIERAADLARRRAEQAAERARMRAEQAERRWKRASGRRSASQAEPVSDEERLRVLRMVEEGKISTEEAADLLAALEGR